nr:MAG TPA: hypothetical protein [Caudoviricetes sp.]
MTPMNQYLSKNDIFTKGKARPFLVRKQNKFYLI